MEQLIPAYTVCNILLRKVFWQPCNSFKMPNYFAPIKSMVWSGKADLMSMKFSITISYEGKQLLRVFDYVYDKRVSYM